MSTPAQFKELFKRCYPESYEFVNALNEEDADLYNGALDCIYKHDPWMKRPITMSECITREDKLDTYGRFMDLFALSKISEHQLYHLKNFGRTYWN